jgi:hypothetical protein
MMDRYTKQRIFLGIACGDTRGLRTHPFSLPEPKR